MTNFLREFEEDYLDEIRFRLEHAKEGIRFLSGGKRVTPRGQMPADGKCGVCDAPVEHRSLNKFYCLNCASYGYVFEYYAALKAFNHPVRGED